MDKHWLHSEDLSDPANKGIGSRSEWVELTSANHPGDKALYRLDLQGKVLWDRHHLPIKILVRRRKKSPHSA